MIALLRIALGALLPAALLLLAQCDTSSHQDVAQLPTAAATPPPAVVSFPKSEALPRAAVAVPVVFDLDALYGLSIDQLKAKLGKPIKDLQSNVDGSQREALFKKKGFLLDVNYDVQSRKVDILILSDNPKRLSYSQLFTLSNADTTSTRYKVEASKGPNTGSSIGVQLTPREEEHSSE